MEIVSSSPKNRDFFRTSSWFNGFIDLLNNNNISNFILGHNDLKLDCLY